ncbi:Hpt domain-containing protein [Vibrio sonorensis]|uniref:Hpt domain-containing protein n=1 Tax=Vibrio sonorensis TaxID=1004316 RepID=UPI001FDFF95B|nr:Hpt domain-containing protein [Vibrio sonorensis]
MMEASEQCIAAGMDDYLTKPVELKTLGNTIEKWLHLSPLPTKQTLRADEEKREQTQAPICLTALENILCTTEPEVIAPLLQGYWESILEDFQLLQTALNNQEAEWVQQISHAAKGAARSAGALQIGDLMEYLQDHAMDQDWQDLTEHVEQVKRAMEKLEHFLVDNGYVDTETSQ